MNYPRYVTPKRIHSFVNNTQRCHFSCLWPEIVIVSQHPRSISKLSTCGTKVRTLLLKVIFNLAVSQIKLGKAFPTFPTCSFFGVACLSNSVLDTFSDTVSGYPRHRENRENGQKNSLSGKTQGIWKFCRNTGKTQGIL